MKERSDNRTAADEADNGAGATGIEASSLAANGTNTNTTGAGEVDVVSNMCWFHSKKGSSSMARGRSKEKSGKLSTQSHWDGTGGQQSNSVQEDLDSLHNMPHPFTDAFDVVLNLFYEKWIVLGEIGFVEYHKKEWGGRDSRRWAVCHNEIGYATTNNGLESNNRVIKLMAKHKREYIDGFLEFMMILVKIWGENSRDVVIPSTRPPLNAGDWANYEKYLRDRRVYGVLEVEHGGVCKYNKDYTFLLWTLSSPLLTCCPFPYLL